MLSIFEGRSPVYDDEQHPEQPAQPPYSPADPFTAPTPYTPTPYPAAPTPTPYPAAPTPYSRPTAPYAATPASAGGVPASAMPAYFTGTPAAAPQAGIPGFGGPTTSGFPGPPIFGAPGVPSQYGYPALPPPRTKRGPSRRSIVALCCLGGLFLVLVAVAAAVGTQRAPAHRSVAIPSTLLGFPQVHNSQLDSTAADVDQQLMSLGGFNNPQNAYFGDGGVPVIYVTAAKLTHRLSSSVMDSFWRGFEGRSGVAMQPVDPGPYGGSMRCGTATFGDVQAGMCASIDSAAYVLVTAYDASPDATAKVARLIIGQVEH